MKRRLSAARGEILLYTVSTKGKEESICQCKVEMHGFWLQGIGVVLAIRDSALETAGRNVKTEGKERTASR